MAGTAFMGDSSMYVQGARLLSGSELRSLITLPLLK